MRKTGIRLLIYCATMKNKFKASNIIVSKEQPLFLSVVLYMGLSNGMP
jgi:hypothetical protein